MVDRARDEATVSQNRKTATEPVRRVSGLVKERNMRKHTQSFNSGVIGSVVTSAQRLLTNRAKNHAGRKHPAGPETLVCR